MAGAGNLQTASNKIQSCIDRSPDSLEREHTNDDGVPIVWEINRGSIIARVEYRDEHDCFQTVFPYNLISDVAAVMTDEDVENVLESYDENGGDKTPEERKAQAAELILNETPPDVAESFAHGILQLISQPKLSYALDGTDEDILYAFHVEKGIYPKSDSFEYRDYDEAMQSVVTIGNAAMSYARRSLDAEAMVAEHSSSEPLPFYQ